MAIYSEFSHQKWWFSIAMLVYQRVRFVSTGQSCVATAWKETWNENPQIGQSLVDLYDVFLRRAKHDLLPFHSLLHLAVAPWLTIERFGWFCLDMSEVLDVEQRWHSCMFIVLYHVDSWLQDSLVIGVPFSAREMAKFIVNSRIFIALGGRSAFSGLWEVGTSDFIWHLGSFGILWDHLGDLKSHFLRRKKAATSATGFDTPSPQRPRIAGWFNTAVRASLKSFVPSQQMRQVLTQEKLIFLGPPKKRTSKLIKEPQKGSKDFDYMGGNQRLKFADTWYSCRKSTPVGSMMRCDDIVPNGTLMIGGWSSFAAVFWWWWWWWWWYIYIYISLYLFNTHVYNIL